MAQVSYTEFRAHLATHLDQVERDRTELVITRQNRADMVVTPLSELEG
ncbi:MAG: type II toxin-antitoxin system Phd/YefM family antitoxin, partial [Methylobacterium sp.]